MSLSPFDSFQSRFVSYLLNRPRTFSNSQRKSCTCKKHFFRNCAHFTDIKSSYYRGIVRDPSGCHILQTEDHLCRVLRSYGVKPYVLVRRSKYLWEPAYKNTTCHITEGSVINFSKLYSYIYICTHNFPCPRCEGI